MPIYTGASKNLGISEDDRINIPMLIITIINRYICHLWKAKIQTYFGYSRIRLAFFFAKPLKPNQLIVPPISGPAVNANKICKSEKSENHFEAIQRSNIPTLLHMSPETRSKKCFLTAGFPIILIKKGTH